MNSKCNVAFKQNLNIDIREWLPGTHTISTHVTIPNGLTSETYNVKLAIYDPLKDKPGVMFANTNRDEEGRYLVGRLKVN